MGSDSNALYITAWCVGDWDWGSQRFLLLLAARESPAPVLGVVSVGFEFGRCFCYNTKAFGL